MTLKQFFTTRAFIICIVLIVLLAAFLYKAPQQQAPESATETSSETLEEYEGVPAFSWKFEQDESLNPDGLPQTNVLLEATYANGAVRTVFIETSPGGCGVLIDTTEADMAKDSTIAQCYAAGAGERYKVTEIGDKYAVKKKVFEEGTPEYNPPAQEYVTIAEFPLSR